MELRNYANKQLQFNSLEHIIAPNIRLQLTVKNIITSSGFTDIDFSFLS